MELDSSSVTVTDIFCGAGGFTTGAKAAGADVRFAANHWKRAIETHNTNYPDIDHFLADISLANPRSFPKTTGLIASPECFPAGTLILTKRGLIPIEDVQEGDEVLTHRNRWRPVRARMSQRADTLLVRGRGHHGLELTSSHPLWVRHCTYPWNNDLQRNERHLGEPSWKQVSQISRDYFWALPKSFGEEVLPIPEVGGRGSEFTPEFWWMVGRWLGDGNLRLRFAPSPHVSTHRRPYRSMPGSCEVCGQEAPAHQRYPHLVQFYCSERCKNKADATHNKSRGSSIQICCAHREADELEVRLNFAPPKGKQATKGEYRWSRREMRTATLFDCPHNGLAAWLLEQFGQHAHGKHLPAWVFTMPEQWRRSFLDGYVSADGNSFRDGVAITTVSRVLAIGITLLALSLGFQPIVGIGKRSHYTIEERTGEMLPLYHIRWATDPRRNYAEATEYHIWGRIKAITPGRQQVEVYNLSVEEDESYVAEGIVVHNCTNHTLAKGKKRKAINQGNMFDDDALPDEAEERSRCTMWDPLKLAEVHNYQFVVLENVVDVRFWSEWMDWIRAWEKLDYVLQLVYLNSMFCHPTPQSRDRLYIVATKRKNRRPNLKITPRAYCQHCGHDVLSVQSWKDPAKRHGKYGKHGQYLYRCPTCAGEVQPYYYAAANAIDWSIPTTRIGDRKKPLEPKTVERIKLGLRKFRGYNPFLTQVNKSDDRIHDLTGALPTQTGTNGLGLVRSPFLMGLSYSGCENGYVYSPEAPFPTQTARQTMALVEPPPFTFELNHTHMQTTGVLDQPLRTQTSYDDTALVVPPFLVELHNHSTVRGLEEALSTMCAGGEHHALITPPQPFIIDHIHEYRLRELTDPLSTIVAEGNHQSIVYPSWLMTYYNNGQMSPIEFASPTVTTLERQALVTATAATLDDEINYEDCGFRMLNPSEIQAAMAFPSEYVITGNRREMVKQLGNACTPPAIEKIMEEVLASLE